MSVISYLLSVIINLLSVIRYLLSAICYLLSVKSVIRFQKKNPKWVQASVSEWASTCPKSHAQYTKNYVTSKIRKASKTMMTLLKRNIYMIIFWWVKVITYSLDICNFAIFSKTTSLLKFLIQKILDASVSLIFFSVIDELLYFTHLAPDVPDWKFECCISVFLCVLSRILVSAAMVSPWKNLPTGKFQRTNETCDWFRKR